MNASVFSRGMGRWVLSLGVLACMTLSLAQSLAQPQAAPSTLSPGSTYPVHPVKIVVPSQPGGGTDIVARVMAQELSSLSGQSFFVENKAGAGNMIGITAVAKSVPDGYTLLMVPSTLVLNTVLYKNISFDPVNNFAPITLAATAPNVLLVNLKVPAQSLGQFIELAKRTPLNYASAGIGTSPHMSMELLKSMAGVELQHIPYKGTAGAMQDLLASQVSALFANALESMPLIASGKVRALAVSGEQRLDQLPNVPTVAQAGVPGYLSTQWYGLLAPSGSPKEALDWLQVNSIKVLKRPEVRGKLAQDGAQAVGSSAQEFALLIKTELEKWTRVAKTAGIEPE
jgi:tripartite-type tricarboxylate transporter receptor subunit TctC